MYLTSFSGFAYEGSHFLSRPDKNSGAGSYMRMGVRNRNLMSHRRVQLSIHFSVGKLGTVKIYRPTAGAMVTLLIVLGFVAYMFTAWIRK